MRLSDLIAEDLVALSTEGLDSVAAEESIRMMIETYKNRGLLTNPHLLNLSEVSDYLNTISQLQIPSHHQLIIQSGHRSKRLQRDPDAIHYSALDVFINADGKITGFIADHYHGKKYNSFNSIFEKIKLPINWIVAGGTPHQQDSTHCPVFTLQHLMLMSHDKTMQDRLTQLSQPETEKFIMLPWFDLPPKYNLYTQSFSTLTKFIDHTKEKETTDPAAESNVLKDANFDQDLSKNLQVDIDNKLINTGMIRLTLKFAHDTFNALGNYTEHELIEICYREHRLSP